MSLLTQVNLIMLLMIFKSALSQNVIKRLVKHTLVMYQADQIIISIIINIINK
jgi:hypothetical protein